MVLAANADFYNEYHTIEKPILAAVQQRKITREQYVMKGWDEEKDCLTFLTRPPPSENAGKVVEIDD